MRFSRAFPIIVIVSLWGGITGQFIWKMYYLPEPILYVVVELLLFTVLSGWAIWLIGRKL